LRNDNCGGSPIPPELKEVLDNAYSSFIISVTTLEMSNIPIGLMRPGIIDIMHKLKSLKDKNLIKSLVIYSNNGHLANLNLAKDIIQVSVGDHTLFSDCIHWSREGREEEYIFPKSIGYANKTWNVLYKLLTNGPTQASQSITPNDVYFFDDQRHVLMNELPQGHYVKVNPYTFKASAETLGEIYRFAIEDSGLLDNANLFELFFKYIKEPFSKDKSLISQLNEHIDRLIHDTKGTVNVDTMPPGPDKGIQLMLDTINSFEESTRIVNVHKSQGGAKRQKTRKQRKQRRKKYYRSRKRR
jgi:hypothetical protein